MRFSLLALLMIIPGLTSAAEVCPHPYFPLEDGLELQYRSGDHRITAKLSEHQREGTTERAKLTVISGDKDSGRSVVTVCDDRGVGTESGGLGALALNSSGMDVKVTESKGVLLPPIEAIKSGKPWTNQVSIQMSPPSSAKLPLGMKPVIRTTFRAETSYVAEEEVTTPAGTFTAIKLRNKTTALAGATGSERSLESVLWFAPGVGVIKVMTGDRVDLELTEIRRPPEAKLTPKP